MRMILAVLMLASSMSMASAHDNDNDDHRTCIEFQGETVCRPTN